MGYIVNKYERPSEILSKNVTPVSGTNTASEEILHSHQIAANIIQVNDFIEVWASVVQNSSAGTKQYRMYINTSNSLAGATLIASSASITTNNLSTYFHRMLPVISDTSVEMVAGSTGGVPSGFSASTVTAATITTPSLGSGFWIIISGQKSTGTDTDTVRWSIIRRSL